MKNYLPAALLGTVFSFLSAGSLFAQQGTQTVFMDDSEDQGPMTVTFLPGATMSDHNIVITGYTGNTSNAQDVFLMRTDIQGKPNHSERWGSNQRDLSESTVQNGNTLMISGVSNDANVGTINHGTIWEYDLASNMLINTRTYQSDVADNFRDIILDGGDYIACGPVMTAVPSGREFGLARIDFGGNIVNSEATGTAASNPSWLLSSISVCTNPVLPGDYFHVGYRQTKDGWFASSNNALSPNNLVQYTNGNGCRMVIRSILPIPGTPEFWVAGFVQNCQSNIAGRDILLMRIDQTGAILQQHVLGSSLNDDTQALRMTMNGDLVLAGTTNSFSTNGDNDIFLMEIDPSLGTVNWLKLFGTDNNDRLLGSDEVMQLYFDSNVGLEYAAIAGQQEDDMGDLDVILITTPLVLSSDERCVGLTTMTSVVSNVVATQHAPQSMPWATLVPTNQPDMPWTPNLADLCPRFKLSTTQEQTDESSQVFHAYPNPVRDMLTVKLPETSSSSFELRISDALGRLIHFELISSDRSTAYLDLSQFTNGIYLLELADDVGQTYREKLLKE